MMDYFNRFDYGAAGGIEVYPQMDAYWGPLQYQLCKYV
jgi:hypothetical protein